MEEKVLNIICNLDDKNITIDEFRASINDNDILSFIDALVTDNTLNVMYIATLIYNIQNERYIRLYAEHENYKKRMRNEISNSNIQVKTDLMDGIFTLVDEFNLALASINNDDIKMLLYKLEKFIADKGYIKIKNDYFNADLHEAISLVSLSNKKTDEIVSVISSGYIYADRVVRYSKVIVNK